MKDRGRESSLFQNGTPFAVLVLTTKYNFPESHLIGYHVRQSIAGPRVHRAALSCFQSIGQKKICRAFVSRTVRSHMTSFFEEGPQLFPDGKKERSFKHTRSQECRDCRPVQCCCCVC